MNHRDSGVIAGRNDRLASGHIALEDVTSGSSTVLVWIREGRRRPKDRGGWSTVRSRESSP